MSKEAMLVALEARKALDEVIPPHLRANRHGQNFMGERYDAIAAAISLLSAAVEEGEGEPPLSVARIAHISDAYPWEISLVWHVAVPDLKARGVVVDALLYVDPPPAAQKGSA